MIDPSLKDIADGGAFDTTTAIRKMCQYLVDVRPTFETKIETLPDVPAPANQGLPRRLIELLADHGYVEPDQIVEATDEELLAIDGIANKTLALIRATVHA